MTLVHAVCMFFACGLSRYNVFLPSGHSAFAMVVESDDARLSDNYYYRKHESVCIAASERQGKV